MLQLLQKHLVHKIKQLESFIVQGLLRKTLKNLEFDNLGKNNLKKPGI